MTDCYFCSKTHTTGYNVPHSKKKTKRRIAANFQSRTLGNKKVKVCTRCIKSFRTLGAIHE